MSPDLVTGTTGFIGGHLAARLDRAARRVRGLTRGGSETAVPFETVPGDLGQPESLAAACAGVGTVFHCAGFAHAWAGDGARFADQHWHVNFEGTRNLVEAAGRAGVRRFVFLSSVKAMGEPGERCVAEECSLPPETPYGQAKRAAEEAVLEAGARYDMHVVNLRLAMVYGPGGRGNLERMVRMIARGLFPPLPETGNRRSLVHVVDVVDAMLLAAERSEAAGRTYIVADPQAYSGRELYDAIRAALGLPAQRWAVPAAALRGAARLGDALGRLFGGRFPFDSEVLDKLLGWACYSPTRLRTELGWAPRVTLAEGLRGISIRNE